MRPSLPRLITGFVVGLALLMSVTAVPPSPAQAQSVMQCMEKCIRDEGNSAAQKKICKSRCANVPGVFQNGGQKKPGLSCMARFKNCQRACPPGDKNCKKACKRRLMNCV